MKRLTKLWLFESSVNVHFRAIILLTLFIVVTLSAQVKADPLPEVRVSHIRRVFHNGQHNAFTDLIRFKGKFYLTFRSCPDGHMVHPTASIIILSSTDARQWKQVHRFSAAKRDTRDPHFLAFKNKLFVYTGTWYSGETTLKSEDYDLNKHLGYGVRSEDGVKWTDPIMLEGTFGHYIWRANTFDGKAYLCGRRKREFVMAPRGGIDLAHPHAVSGNERRRDRVSIRVRREHYRYRPARQKQRPTAEIAPALHPLGTQRYRPVHRRAVTGGMGRTLCCRRTKQRR